MTHLPHPTTIAAAHLFGKSVDEWCLPSPMPNPHRGERRIYSPMDEIGGTLIWTIEIGSEFSGEIP